MPKLSSAKYAKREVTEMKQKDIDLLAAIGERLSESGIAARPAEIDGIIVLELEGRAESEDKEFDCTVTICHPSEDTTAVQLLVSLFYQLDEEKAKAAASLLPEMNYFLEIGSFGCLVEGGYLYFSHSFFTDGLSEDSVLRCFAAYLEAVTLTALKGKKLLMPVIKGDLTPEEADKDELRIVQF